MILEKTSLVSGHIQNINIPTSMSEENSIFIEGDSVAVSINGDAVPIPKFAPFNPDSDKPVGIYQAEDADLIVGANIVSSHSGYTGNGFVDYTETTDAYVEWEFESLVSGVFELLFRFAIGRRPLDLIVNGVTVVRMPLAGGTGVTSWIVESHNAPIQKGFNTVRLKATGSSGPNLDRMEIRSINGESYFV